MNTGTQDSRENNGKKGSNYYNCSTASDPTKIATRYGLTLEQLRQALGADWEAVKDHPDQVEAVAQALAAKGVE